MQMTTCVCRVHQFNRGMEWNGNRNQNRLSDCLHTCYWDFWILTQHLPLDWSLEPRRSNQTLVILAFFVSLLVVLYMLVKSCLIACDGLAGLALILLSLAPPWILIFLCWVFPISWVLYCWTLWCSLHSCIDKHLNTCNSASGIWGISCTLLAFRQLSASR